VYLVGEEQEHVGDQAQDVGLEPRPAAAHQRTDPTQRALAPPCVFHVGKACANIQLEES